MSNYRRLISYMYAYEGQVKGKNIGFAKLEVKNGQCKIQVSVKKVYESGNDVGVYLLAEGGEVLIGKIYIRNGNGEFRTSVHADNVELSGFSMSQMYGLSIHDMKNPWVSYTTIWEDAVAQTAQVDLEHVTSKNYPNQKTQEEKVQEIIQEIEAEVEEQEQQKEKELKEEQESQRKRREEEEKAKQREMLQEETKEAERAVQSSKDAIWQPSQAERKPMEGIEEEQRIEKQWSVRIPIDVSVESDKEAKRESDTEGKKKENIDTKTTAKNDIKTRSHTTTKTNVETDRKVDREVEVELRENREQKSEKRKGNAEGKEESERKETDSVRISLPISASKQQTEKGNAIPAVAADRTGRVDRAERVNRVNRADSGGGWENRLSEWSNGLFGKKKEEQNTYSGMELAKKVTFHLFEEAGTTKLDTPKLGKAEEREKTLTEKAWSFSPSSTLRELGQPKAEKASQPFLQDNEKLEKFEEEESRQEEQAQKLWEELKSMYPKMQEFDYESGCEILAIKPKDIGLLPRENWVYGNNSFLLHGYYNYRYLILVQLTEAKGEHRYLLGVPGQYYNNDKYMASMFGFSGFVLSKRQPTENGRFGYWYTNIKMEMDAL